MLSRNRGRSPPGSADSDLPGERLPDQLSSYFISRTVPAQSALPRERLARLAVNIHRLGPRPLFELFVELQAGGELGSVLERYARIAPFAGFIQSLGGDRLPQPKLVRGRRS